MLASAPGMFLHRVNNCADAGDLLRVTLDVNRDGFTLFLKGLRVGVAQGVQLRLETCFLNSSEPAEILGNASFPSYCRPTCNAARGLNPGLARAVTARCASRRSRRIASSYAAGCRLASCAGTISSGCAACRAG